MKNKDFGRVIVQKRYNVKGYCEVIFSRTSTILPKLARHLVNFSHGAVLKNVYIVQLPLAILAMIRKNFHISVFMESNKHA